MHTRLELKVLCGKQESYKGQLDASFSGGVNLFSIHEGCWYLHEELATDAR